MSTNLTKITQLVNGRASVSDFKALDYDVLIITKLSISTSCFAMLGEIVPHLQSIVHQKGSEYPPKAVIFMVRFYDGERTC